MAEPGTTKCTPPPKGSALLRENLFEERTTEDEGELLKRREPTMLRRGKKLVAPPFDGTKKYTVVFDLDETVVYARDGPLYARAYLKDLFRSIKDDFEVIVWTAGERDYAKCVLEEINEDHIIQHLVYRHKKWFNEEDYTKDLRQLGRDLNYTIMIENTPDCVRANPQNGIIVEDFEVLPETTDEETSLPPTPVPSPPPSAVVEGNASHSTPHSADGTAESTADASPTIPAEPPAVQEDGPSFSPSSSAHLPKRRRTTDRTLYLLREVLASLVQSGETVPAFLAACELLTSQVVLGSDGNEIPIYHLGTRRRRRDAGASRKVVKVNRDKAPAALTAAPPVGEQEAKEEVESPDEAQDAVDVPSPGGPEAVSDEADEAVAVAGRKRERPVSDTSLEETPLLPSNSTDSIGNA